jgi:hypothetical protein
MRRPLQMVRLLVTRQRPIVTICRITIKKRTGTLQGQTRKFRTGTRERSIVDIHHIQANANSTEKDPHGQVMETTQCVASMGGTNGPITTTIRMDEIIVILITTDMPRLGKKIAWQNNAHIRQI